MRTIQRRALRGEPLRVVQDQTGAPTWSRLVAEATALSVARTGGDFGDLSGLYHLSCAGTTSWYGFASAIVQHLVAHGASSVVEVTPIDSADYPTAARRPKNSLLSCVRLRQRFGIELPSWQETMTLCLQGE